MQCMHEVPATDRPRSTCLSWERPLAATFEASALAVMAFDTTDNISFTLFWSREIQGNRHGQAQGVHGPGEHGRRY